MANAGARSLLRERGEHSHARVTNIELFFDLVFVFAVTQLSHRLLKDMSLQGALETGLLFLAVWWVWIYTSWVTNWLDPDRVPVRLMMFAMMLAGLVLAGALPHAFEAGHALAFACTYVLMQVGRTLFMVWALRRLPEHQAKTRNFQRMMVWFMAGGVCWIMGAWLGGEAQTILWIVAVAIEYLSAWVGFWVPFLGRSASTDWDIEGEHLAERCALFIMIALGESILIMGSTAASMPATPGTAGAFLAAFLGSVAMWWLYFNAGVAQGTRQIVSDANPGRLGRLVYTYIHLLIVAGIIVSAVADEIVLAHPSGHIEPVAILPIVGGPALFLLGNLLFKSVTWGRLPWSHMAGLLALCLAAAAAHTMTPLLLGALTSGVLMVVAAWETFSLNEVGEVDEAEEAEKQA